jgi:uncharacterized protein
MNKMSTRRDFLSVGLLVPVAGWASTSGMMPSSAQLVATQGLSYRTLGKTGMKVTSVGFGCMITSDPSVIERAADAGINYFDTARGYQHGNNERMVGAALKRKRQDIFIASKTEAGDKAGALQQLDTSLKELGTDHLDVWHLHGKDSPGEAPDDLFEAQQIAKQQGKIRFAGLSTHNPKVMIPFLIQKGATDVVLLTYNFSMDQGVSDVVDQAQRAGMGVVAMKVMAGGFRSVKPDNPLAPKLQRQGAMLAALKWVLKNPNVGTTIPSMTDMDQLEENLKAMAEPYTDKERTILARHLDDITPLYCRMCGECSGQCRQGVPVAEVLRYLSYADGYGQFALGREHFLKLPAAVAEARCGNCGECTVKCPNGVRVRERLTRAQELFAA